MEVTKFSVAGATLILALGAQCAAAAPNIGASKAPAVVSNAAPSAMVEFRVFLPLRHPQQLDELLTELHDPTSSKYQQWLQPEEFLQRFGPTPTDLAALKQTLISRGLTITREDAHGVHAQGSAREVSKLFAVPLRTRTHGSHTRFMAKGTPQLPSELAALNARIVGLEALEAHHAHARITHKVDASPDNRIAETGPYWFDDLKQAYDYPAYSHKTDGSGVTAAVLMSDLLFSGDIKAVFDHEKFTAITGVAAPKVKTVKIDGGGIEDGNGSFEASLDVQQILGGAPATDVTLVSVPDLSDDHLIDGYAYIVDSNKFDLVNSSFGGCELGYTAAYNEGTDYTYILQQYHEIFAQGNAQGITFVASSGDEGALICPSPDYLSGASNATFLPGVSSPADDPSVTAVGGGNLITQYKSGQLDSGYVRESGYADPEVPYDPYGLGTNVTGGVWGAGGGVSEIWKKPLYQLLANTGSSNRRTLPDVGMQVGGCPESASSCGNDDSAAVVAYGVNYGGGYYAVIGTSVSSPEFVGALALWEQQFGKHHRQGNVNYFLYAKGAVQALGGGTHAPDALQFYHRGIPGFDGYYKGGKPSANYDYIYGQGSPNVRKLFDMREFPAAGVPQTPGNP